MPNDTTNTAPDERGVLKPCPFCGGVRLSGARNETGSVVTVCDTCEAMGPSQVGTSLAAICAAWNTRTPPQVKPLVWSDECRKNSFPDRWQAEMPCGAGDYTVAGSTRKNEWRWYRNGHYVVGFYDQEPTTIEAAKAAAQADYTRRILDALA